jgi:hypothetical protein
VGSEPSRVRYRIGTCSAIVCTLRPLRLFTPALAAIGIRCRFWNGRSAPRSKIEPRSTQNGSRRWPAKTVMPSAMVVTAAAASAS